MMQTICILLFLFVAFIFLGVIVGGLIAGYCDWKNPPSPESLVKRWQSVYPVQKDEYRVTQVYQYVSDNQIIGKVVKQDDGLYRATMWNGSYKDFIYEYDATKSVENYQPRIVK